MNDRHEQLPAAPLTPAEELALTCVEGGASAQARQDLTERDPALAGLVRGMRRDREIVVSLGEEKAPPGLGERVLASLERDALLRMDLSKMEQAAEGESIPISQVRIVREGFRWNRSWTPRVLQAAGLVLLVGGGVFWGTLVLRGTGGAPIAPVLPGGPRTFAINDHAGEQASPISEPPGAAAKLAASEANIESDIGSAMSQPIAAGEIGPSDALALANEGRLLVRVVSAQGAPPALRAGGTDWRVSREASPEVVAAVDQWRSSREEQPKGRDPQILADARPRAFVVPFRGVVGVAESLPALAAPYIVNTVASTDAIATLTRSLASTGAMVELVRLDRPLRQDAPADPESILWWTRAPSAWIRRVSVPVVVENR